MIKLPFNNPVKAVVGIVLFLIAFLAFRACEGAESTAQIGTAIASSEISGVAIGYSETFYGKWEVGAMLYSEQEFRKPEGNLKIGHNAIFHVGRVVTWKRVELTLGLAYWQNTNRLGGCHTTFSLAAATRVWSRAWLMWRHFSNAGTCKPNSGQDSLTIGWRFE